MASGSWRCTSLRVKHIWVLISASPAGWSWNFGLCASWKSPIFIISLIPLSFSSIFPPCHMPSQNPPGADLLLGAANELLRKSLFPRPPTLSSTPPSFPRIPTSLNLCSSSDQVLFSPAKNPSPWDFSLLHCYNRTITLCKTFSKTTYLNSILNVYILQCINET